MAKFFRFPWATTGDKTAIPDPTDGSGAVSYSQGFGPDYERDPTTDPLAKRVPRAETNQYIFDITDNLRQYQIYGVPDWYPASANGGVAISYPINARVRHNDLVYRSIVTTNTVEPGTDVTKWVVDAAVANPLANLTQAQSSYLEGAPFSLPDNTVTTLPITSFSDDGQSDWAQVGNTLVCQRSGRYSVSGSFGWATLLGAPVTALTSGARVGGAEYLAVSVRVTSGTLSNVVGGSADVTDFTAGNVVTLYAYQQRGSAVSIYGASRISLQRLTV